MRSDKKHSRPIFDVYELHNNNVRPALLRLAAHYVFSARHLARESDKRNRDRRISCMPTPWVAIALSKGIVECRIGISSTHNRHPLIREVASFFRHCAYTCTRCSDSSRIVHGRHLYLTIIISSVVRVNHINISRTIAIATWWLPHHIINTSVNIISF